MKQQDFTDEDYAWLNNMRKRGFCVVCFAPDELEGVDPYALDDMLTAFGLEQIKYLKENSND